MSTIPRYLKHIYSARSLPKTQTFSTAGNTDFYENVVVEYKYLTCVSIGVSLGSSADSSPLDSCRTISAAKLANEEAKHDFTVHLLVGGNASRTPCSACCRGFTHSLSPSTA